MPQKEEHKLPPQIKFQISEEEISEQPKVSPFILQKIIQQLSLDKIAIELEMNKHHGISIENIIFVLLLYSSYGVKSISQLAKKAQKDVSLAKYIEDVKKIDNKIILYFQELNDISTYEELLDRIISSSQDRGQRLSTKKNGILIVDDSPLVKTGKKMDKIEIIFDHVEKRYVLGYVLVATSYADDTKSYCVNFEFRFSTEEDKKRAEQKKLKKSAKIDLRKKESLIEWINVQINNGAEIQDVEVSGVNLKPKTLRELDKRDIIWLGLPSTKTVLSKTGNKQWELEKLKEKTLRKTPMILELEGWKIYTKPVVLNDYGEVTFCIVNDLQHNELGCFLTKKNVITKNAYVLQNYFNKQQPADNNKLKIALRLFERAKNAGVQAETACGDAWFNVAWFIEEALQIGGIKRFVSRIKSNTEVSHNNQLIKVNELWGKVALKLISGRSIKAGATIVDVKGFKHPIKLVFVQELDECGIVKGKYILVCTDTHYSIEQTIRAYKLRWSIECFFRTGKQRFGLDKFHVRKFRKIHSHVTFSFISYLLIASLKNSTPKLNDLTFGQIIDQFLNSLVKLKQTTNKLIVYIGSGFQDELAQLCDDTS